MLPVVLTIAGSDSGGGAGIQADIKTFAALGCFGVSALTALTAQSPQGVGGIHSIPAPFLHKQIDILFENFTIDAVKIGMLHSAAAVQAVRRTLARYSSHQVVLDPVMAAQSGGRLLQPNALLPITQLFPLVTLVTPNLVEASLLLARPIHEIDHMQAAAQELITKFKARSVLLKGGHLKKEKGIDCLVIDGQQPIWLHKETIDTPNTHGTGCTYSAAIAAYLARGYSLITAVKKGKEYLHGALNEGKKKIPGQALHHFWRKKCR